MITKLKYDEDAWVYFFIVGFLIATPSTLWIDYNYLSPLDPGSAIMIPLAMFLTVVFGGLIYLVFRLTWRLQS